MIAALTIEGWQAGAGAIVIVLTAFAKLYGDYRKDRAESRLNEIRDKREEVASHARLQVLIDIAASNQAIRDAQIESRVTLALLTSSQVTQHRELINALNSACKAKPIFPIENQQNERKQ